LFYTPDITGKDYTLSEEESKHCVRVLRLQIGDTLHLIDGRGGFYEAEIMDDHSKRCLVKVVKETKDFEKRNNHLHIAIAPTKNIERTEWFLEKATEIGIDEISFLLCDHSERKDVKLERLDKVVTSAMKQSLKAYHPQLHDAERFKYFIKKPFSGDKYIAHCEPEEKQHLKDIYIKGVNALILIGPEGDFSPAEIQLALENGFKPISLGKSRLRTETAAVLACAAIALANE
jgi:16S rRNA (uracil1498-N3)-methyltransferase